MSKYLGFRKKKKNDTETVVADAMKEVLSHFIYYWLRGHFKSSYNISGQIYFCIVIDWFYNLNDFFSFYITFIVYDIIYSQNCI